MTKTKQILIACESSGTVRDAFRALGHDAWSADLLDDVNGSPWHIKGDAKALLNQGWDMLIAHPTCTFLTNAGSKWLYNGGQAVNGRDPVRWAKLAKGAELFNAFWNADIPQVCVENPIPHKYAVELIGAKPTQYVQPYEFGVPQTKKTGLWLKGLPKLVETDNVLHLKASTPKSEWNYVHMLPPGPDRWRKRSVTCPGIADAMAAQWGAL